MLRDFAVFDAEDIDSSLTAIAGFQRDVIVDNFLSAVPAIALIWLEERAGTRGTISATVIYLPFQEV